MDARRLLLLVWLAGLLGCADSCGCGEDASGKGDQAAPDGTKATSSARPGGLDGGAIGPRFSELEDSPLRERLGAEAAELRKRKLEGELRDPASLTAAAPDAIAGFEASAAAVAASRQVGTATTPTVQRRYASGERELTLRITDARQLPSAIRGFARRLTVVGDAVVGNQRAVERGERVMLQAYHPDRKRARATMLVEGRYLIEADVRGAGDAEDAVKVLEAVPLEPFASP